MLGSQLPDLKARPIIICIGDGPDDPNALTGFVGSRFDVIAARSVDDVLVMVEQTPVAVVLATPDAWRGELGSRLRSRCGRAALATMSDAEGALAVVAAGHAHCVITKPWRAADMYVIDQLVRSVDLERRNTDLAEELERIKAATMALPNRLRDPLTGLYTHLAFQERLRDEVQHALKRGQPVSLVIADIDHFASVNYDLGYQVGDEILRRIGFVLLQDDASPDVGRTPDLVARYSGEEFVVLLHSTKAEALTKAVRLRDAVAAAEMPSSRKLSLSIGVACLPEDAADPEGLLTAAEAALRGAKRGGPGRIHFFSANENRTPGNRSQLFGGHVAELDRFRSYQERMNEVMVILNRDRSLSCLLVDLSRLHRVELDLGIAHHSEIYDHAAGVLDHLRGTLLDTADLICRSGDGDGYLVILAPRAEHVDLEDLAQRVERAVVDGLSAMVSEVMHEQPRIIVGSARVLGNSLLRPERLVARLVVDATESARNLRERTAHRDRAALQDVILGDGLTTVYQPIVDLGTGDIFAYEALSRGPHGTSFESPATLFAIAEEVDLTVELDRACFRGALRSAKTLEPIHRLFVNLLPMSFYDIAFIEVEVGNLLTAAGLTPANIVFEITERLAIENFASFKRALDGYTAMGFGIAIDDVGTRHSNLETVMSLRPHFIKISDVLVRGIASSAVKREMMRSLHHIAETIDAVMIAEGIEHVEDVIALRELGMRYAQGYYMARPGPPFPMLSDHVRATLRSIPAVATVRLPAQKPMHRDDDDDDDPIPRRPFGRNDDELTSDFTRPEKPTQRRVAVQHERAREPRQSWQPFDDEDGTGEALLSSLGRPSPKPD